MWSAGCSLYEIISGKVLFPGNHYIEQINLIIDIRGTPDDDTKKQITNEYALKYIESIPAKPKKNLKEMITTAPDDAVDLLDKMLNLDSLKRITVDEALKHPFLESMHDPEDEPLFEGTIDFSFEDDTTLDLEKLKRLILQEIATYNPSYYDLL